MADGAHKALGAVVHGHGGSQNRPWNSERALSGLDLGLMKFDADRTTTLANRHGHLVTAV